MSQIGAITNKALSSHNLIIEKANQNTFIYRGIAARHFQKTFVLADGVEVSGASLEKGLLNVFLLRKNIEPKVKKIKIDSNESVSYTHLTLPTKA